MWRLIPRPVRLPSIRRITSLCSWKVMDLKQKVIILNQKDNVATTLTSLKAGDSLELEINGQHRLIKLATDVPFGHKLSLTRIEPNSPVVKYGEVIGISTAAIEPGDYVHIHNIVSARGRGDLEGGAK
jgi:altronate dehydratase small subunit